MLLICFDILATACDFSLQKVVTHWPAGGKGVARCKRYGDGISSHVAVDMELWKFWMFSLFYFGFQKFLSFEGSSYLDALVSDGYCYLSNVISKFSWFSGSNKTFSTGFPHGCLPGGNVPCFPEKDDPFFNGETSWKGHPGFHRCSLLSAPRLGRWRSKTDGLKRPYHLVMTNSLPWKIHPFLSSANHLFLWAIYTMAMLNNQRVYLLLSKNGFPS